MEGAQELPVGRTGWAFLWILAFRGGGAPVPPGSQASGELHLSPLVISAFPLDLPRPVPHLSGTPCDPFSAERILEGPCTRTCNPP